MGNRICCGRRSLVDERLTRPQRLLRQPSNVDYRKLRRLIRAEKLAPCFDAEDEPGFDLEECPICFFYFPSLNRSTCCSKGICTECFLQMKPMSPLQDSTNCPFCKTSGYAVEYRGTRSDEEKAHEKAEEQKVNEARIRMQRQDSQRVNHGMLVDNVHSVLEVHLPKQCFQGLCDVRGTSASTPERDADTDDPLPSSSGSPNLAYVQDGDHEDALLIEAIWQSLKDPKLWKNGISGASNLEPDVRIHVKEEYTNSRVVMSKDFLESLSAGPESPDTDTGRL